MPDWESLCDALMKKGGYFELRDVVSAEHRRCVQALVSRYSCAITTLDSTVTFHPPRQNGQ